MGTFWEHFGNMRTVAKQYLPSRPKTRIQPTNTQLTCGPSDRTWPQRLLINTTERRRRASRVSTKSAHKPRLPTRTTGSMPPPSCGDGNAKSSEVQPSVRSRPQGGREHAPQCAQQRHNAHIKNRSSDSKRTLRCAVRFHQTHLLPQKERKKVIPQNYEGTT